MSHIQTVGNSSFEHVFHTSAHHVGTAGCMRTSPVIEPSGPVLATHQRNGRLIFCQHLELLVDIGTGTEVDGTQHAVEHGFLEIGAPGTGEQLYILESGFHDNIFYLAEIFLVVAKARIFVFHLHHQNVTAIAQEHRGELLAHTIQENAGALHKESVFLASDFDIFLFEQPPGQSAHIPFGADIRSRTHDDIHSVLLSQFTEFADIILSFKIKFIHFLFVNVPEHIQTDGVHPHSLAHLDAMLPIFFGNSGIMDFCRPDNKGLAVQKESTVSQFKSRGRQRLK